MNKKDQSKSILPTSDIDRDLTTIKIIKTEVNINRNPFFCLSDKDIPKTLKIERKDMVEIDGRMVNVLWKVSANPEYGYPGPFAKQVHKAFEVLFSQHGFPLTKAFPFSIYQILEIIGVAKKGKNYEKVRTAIQQLVSTTIEAKGSFYHKGKQRYIVDTYHLFDRVVFKGEISPDGSIAETNFVFISDAYLDSINSYYIKDIDWNYYQVLSNVTTGRLYEVLDMLFYPIVTKRLPYLKIHYNKLCEYMPLKPQKYMAKAKQQLDRHHEKLVETGFLEAFKYEQKMTARGNDFSILYYPGKMVKKTRQQQIEMNWDGSEIDVLATTSDPTDGITRTDSDLRRKFVNQIEVFGIRNAEEVLNQSPHTIETISRLLADFEQKVKGGYPFRSSPQAWLYWALTSLKYVSPIKSVPKEALKKKSRLQERQAELQVLYSELRDLLNEDEYDQEWFHLSDKDKLQQLINSFPFDYQARNKRKPSQKEIDAYSRTVHAELDDIIQSRKELMSKRREDIELLRKKIQVHMDETGG